MKLYYGALTTVIAGGFLVSGCGPKVCENGSQPPTGVCAEDCGETEFYNDDDFACQTIEDEDCEDGEDNDGNGDIDCRDDACESDSACVEPWVPTTFSAQGFFTWDGANQQAVSANANGNTIPSTLVVSVHTDDFPTNFDSQYECAVFAAAESAAPMAAFATEESIPVGWLLPSDAVWSADGAASQAYPAGCATIADITIDVMSKLRVLQWGLGAQSEIDSQYRQDLLDANPDEADNLFGAGFYLGDGTEGSYAPEGWAVAFDVTDTFEIPEDDTLLTAAEATTGASNMFVQTYPGFLYGADNLLAR